MRKNLMTLLLTVALLMLLSTSASAAPLGSKVTATIPTFPVTMNGQIVDNIYREYPFLVYDDITYFPMTYWDMRFLGVSNTWNASTGSTIVTGGGTAEYKPTLRSSANNNRNTAIVSTGKYTVNGVAVDNAEQGWPILTFRDVPYFPLTWGWCEEFGWKVNFDINNGLSVNTSSAISTGTITNAPTNAVSKTNKYAIEDKIKIYGTDIGVNSADGVSVSITWENLSKKEIKYIHFKTEIYNRVNDRLSCDIRDKDTMWLTQTGPIPQGKGMYSCLTSSTTNGCERAFLPDISYDEFKNDEENGWEGQYWDCVWYNSQAHYAKIVGIEIEYMDGTVFSETNRAIFEELDIITLDVNDSVFDYVWEYPVSAQLVAQNLPYSNKNIYVSELIIEKVEGISANEALFVCKLKGSNHIGYQSIFVNVIDKNGNEIDSEEVPLFDKGEFISYEFYIKTPIDGVYYPVIENKSY